MQFRVSPLDATLQTQLEAKIDQKTKPLGALGLLETTALKIALIQNTLCPQLQRPLIAVFAGDHGVTEENVSAFPSEVTAQMVLNFLNGGAAINVFARQHGAALKIVDAGVKVSLPGDDRLINRKIAAGTENFMRRPAMNVAQCNMALEKSAELVSEWHATGSNIIGFGDMGIGNTSSAAMLIALFADVSLADAVGPGAGLSQEGVDHKLTVLRKAQQRTGMTPRAAGESPLSALAEYGGYEIAMICGGMLRAAELGMVVLVDGFIATSALLCGQAMHSNLRDYAVFTHRSAEPGHALALSYLRCEPLLDLKMRLGEGTGAAMALPIIYSAVAFLNEMSSFADAEVSGKKG
jgi:nicotinate-nucleotide--dimethylbenzimidazole phosphoribosyltransferase